MSFFGFDTTLPRDRDHHQNAPGFSAPQDAFASFSNEPADNEPLDFEDTYEGYGGELDENADTLNDDTFGDATVKKDFDFSGQTGGVARAFEEERMRWAATNAPGRLGSEHQKPAKPKRTGYEYVPQQLEADADLWGIAPKPSDPAPVPQQARKAMTLEEVEAMMLSQGAQQSTHQASQVLQSSTQAQAAQQIDYQHPQILQRPPPHLQQQQQQQAQIPTGPRQHRQQQSNSQPIAPRQILQNPNRQHPQSGRQGHTRNQSSYNGPIITNPAQIMNLSEEEKAAYLQEEARRAKRNHKIHLLSKYNGLMTPQDKNFITRIQLQQLVTATGTINADSPESILNEDFYYQVYSQIRGAPRQNPHQPANRFAQTYLFQTGGRYGNNRRHPRGGENHVQRMEQQVQRAVEAAKAKPKNSQLVIEGSLGKISFSNSKTPKPLLNIKRQEGEGRPIVKRPVGQDAVAERRETLKNIEKVYAALMTAEDTLRHEPREAGPVFDEWADSTAKARENLWHAFKADVPINENPSIIHPFIAIIGHAKGKKALARAWNLLPSQQRTIVVTIIIVHLDSLDVVQSALITNPVTAQIKEDIELFFGTVMQGIFSRIHEVELHIVLGLLGLMISRTALRDVVRTKVGLVILTTLISRAEVLREAVSPDHADLEQQASLREYVTSYTSLFNSIEPVLPAIFPNSSPIASDDVYVWQFLAAMGAAANAEQQQRLVIGVKDRVMSSVQAARALPPSEMNKRKDEVNIFMRALGLDVDLLI